MRLLGRVLTVAATFFTVLVLYHLLVDDDGPLTLEELLHEHDEDVTTFLH